MSTKLIAVIAASVLLPASAFASSQIAHGAVKSVNMIDRTVTLDDGVSYKLPKGYDLRSLKNGAVISIDWQMENNLRRASEVTADPTMYASGQIEAINTKAGSARLTDGHTYKLPSGFDTTSLKAGDFVIASFDESGGVRTVMDLSKPQIEKVSGMVMETDPEGHSIRLDDDAAYQLPQNANAGEFQPGDHVTIAWFKTGDVRQAAEVTPQIQ
jgi:Cu/Ag efflux protein CusF